MPKKKSDNLIEEPVAQETKKSWLANKCERCGCTCGGKMASLGWFVLLFGGLAHMLPEQMRPLLEWGGYGVRLQLVVGVLAVTIALYFLMGSEE